MAFVFGAIAFDSNRGQDGAVVTERKKVYFSEFGNTLGWWDAERKKWRPTDDHPDPDCTDPNYDWVWVWDGKLPEGVREEEEEE